MSTALQFPELQPRYFPESEQTESWPTSSGDSYYLKTRSWCEAAYEEAKADVDASEELRLIGKFIDYINGKQWKTGKRASYKSSPVLNKTVRLFQELVGHLTDIDPFIQVKCTSTEDRDIQQEKVINGALQSWSLENDFDLTLAQCVSYAALTTAFAKQQFNPELNMGAGEIEMLPLSPDKVLPLKPRAGGGLQSASAVIYQEWHPLSFFRQRYGLRGKFVHPDTAMSQWSGKPSAPQHMPSQLFQMLSPAMQRTVAGSSSINFSAVPMALLREFWLKDPSINEGAVPVRVGDHGKNWSYTVPKGMPLYPRGRLIVLGGDQILSDGPNPYWHGQFPFSMLRLNVVPWSFYGLSDMKSWIDLQDIVNQILAGVIDTVKKATNPAWYAPRNAIGDAAWSSFDFSMPGARLGYSPTAVHEPKFAPPPVLPGFVLPLMQQIEREMDQQSTGALASEAARKKQMPGADAIDAIKNEKTTPLRLKGRNIEAFVRDNGRMMVPNLFQFWDSKKRLQRLGHDGLTYEDFDWDPGSMIPASEEGAGDPVKHIRKFKFMVEPGSLLRMARTEKIAQAARLRMMGEISRKRFFQMAGVNVDQDSNEAELKAEIPPQPKKGKGKH